VDTEDEQQNSELLLYLPMAMLGSLTHGTADHLARPMLFSNTMFDFHVWKYRLVRDFFFVHGWCT